MMIIRDLDENGNLIETSTHQERLALWNYYYRNSKCPDRMIDYKLVELCMFGNSKSSISFDTNNIGSRDNNSFFLVF